MNTINNNHLPTDDIKIVKKIFGPDIGTIKYKTTRRKPLPVVDVCSQQILVIFSKF